MKIVSLSSNPYSAFARLVCAPHWIKLLLSLLLLLTLSAYPLFEIMQLRQQLALGDKTNQTLQQQQNQQRQIVALLNNKTTLDKTELDPQIAAKIPPLNQKLQSAVTDFPDLTITLQQWQFSRFPLLQLELQGRFYQISRFLNHISQQFDELKLLKIELQHTENQSATHAKIELFFMEEISDE